MKLCENSIGNAACGRSCHILTIPHAKPHIKKPCYLLCIHNMVTPNPVRIATLWRLNLLSLTSFCGNPFPEERGEHGALDPKDVCLNRGCDAVYSCEGLGFRVSSIIFSTGMLRTQHQHRREYPQQSAHFSWQHQMCRLPQARNSKTPCPDAMTFLMDHDSVLDSVS